MIDGRVIRGVDASNPTFRKSLGRIRDKALQQEIIATLKSLLFLALDAAPRKLHMHQLQGRKVQSARDEGQLVSVWTLHVTANDAYKASFTLEDGVVYLRLCDEHDVVDKNP